MFMVIQFSQYDMVILKVDLSTSFTFPMKKIFFSYRSLKGYKKKRRFNIQQLVDNGPIDIQVFHWHIYI